MALHYEHVIDSQLEDLVQELVLKTENAWEELRFQQSIGALNRDLAPIDLFQHFIDTLGSSEEKLRLSIELAAVQKKPDRPDQKPASVLSHK